MRSVLDYYLGVNIVYRTFVALILASIVGYFLPDNEFIVKSCYFMGQVFVRLLKMIVVPIVVTSIIVSIYNMFGAIDVAKLGLRLIILYTITTLTTISVGLLIGKYMFPVINISEHADKVETVKNVGDQVNFSDKILHIIPTNIFRGLTEGNMLAIIFVATVIGICLAKLKNADDKMMRESADKMFHVINAFYGITYQIIKIIVELTPFGVFGLVSYLLMKYGNYEYFISLSYFIGCCFLGYSFILFVFYPTLLLFTKTNPLTFYRGAKEAMMTAFFTRSSSGTLPVTIKCAEKMKLDKNIYSFSLPIGATINMDGTGMYHVIVASFIANSIGLDITFGLALTMLFTALLGAIGTAGVPGALVMVIVLLNAMGIDISTNINASIVFSMVIGIDFLLDMSRTLCNVTGDLVGVKILERFVGKSSR